MVIKINFTSLIKSLTLLNLYHEKFATKYIKTNWTNEVVETVEVDSDNEFRSTYSIWTKS